MFEILNDRSADNRLQNHPQKSQNLPIKWLKFTHKNKILTEKTVILSYVSKIYSKAYCRGLKDTPVILINGARQTGKSTLCRQLVEEGDFNGQIMTMDDPTTLTAA